MFDIHRICEVIDNNYNDAFPQYGEDYYGKEIMTADWNRVPEKLTRFIEKHMETLFYDEVFIDDNYIFHRTDEPTYLIDNGTVISIDELDDNDALKEYIQQNLVDDPYNAMDVHKIIKRLPEIATIVESGFQTGLHRHMTDNPKSIIESHPDYGKSTLFFAVTDSHMFATEYDLWQLKEEEDETV